MTATDRARQAAKYLREEADFNRSWVDGRRGGTWSDEYRGRRLELAAERDAWADAIEKLIDNKTV